MKRQTGDIFHHQLTATNNRSISASDGTKVKNLITQLRSSSYQRQEKKRHIIIDIATPTLSKSCTTQHERACLVEASSINFGDECLRLVNIVFQTSQTFPSIMGTCNHVCQHLRKELLKKYPMQYFHIIIGQNNSFGFAIDDDEYFAEIEQAQYRVIIFTTKLKQHLKLETHDPNSDMMLQWKTLAVKQSKK